MFSSAWCRMRVNGGGGELTHARTCLRVRMRTRPRPRQGIIPRWNHVALFWRPRKIDKVWPSPSCAYKSRLAHRGGPDAPFSACTRVRARGRPLPGGTPYPPSSRHRAAVARCNANRGRRQNYRFYRPFPPSADRPLRPPAVHNCTTRHATTLRAGRRTAVLAVHARVRSYRRGSSRLHPRPWPEYILTRPAYRVTTGQQQFFVLVDFALNVQNVYAFDAVGKYCFIVQIQNLLN